MYKIKLYGADKQAYLTNDEALIYFFHWYLNDPNVGLQSSFKVLGNLFHNDPYSDRMLYYCKGELQNFFYTKAVVFSEDFGSRLLFNFKLNINSKI